MIKAGRTLLQIILQLHTHKNKMKIQDLIDFHQKGMEACAAYKEASGPKDLNKHYQKRADWHGQAIELLEKLMKLEDKNV